MQNKKTKTTQVAYALSMGLELISGVIVGLTIGYYLDKWFNTKPICLIIFIILGTIAGFLNLYRKIKQLM